MRLLFSVILIVLSAYAQLTNDLLNRVSADNICEYISTLASDDFQGRKPNTIGEIKTIDYIIDLYKKAGLIPGNNGSWVQEVPLANITPKPPETIVIRNGSSSIDINFKDDFVMRSPTSNSKIEIDNAEFVFAGFGINAPEMGWNDYESIDARGKIVIVLSQYPGYFGADKTTFTVDEGANLYAQSFYKKNEAARQGADGILFIYEDQGPIMANWTLYERTALDPKMDLINTGTTQQLKISGIISTETMNRIMKLAGKENYDYKKDAIRKDFMAMNLNITTSFVFENEIERITSSNVVGLIEGSENPDEVIIYSAHWDHEGINQPVEGDSIYNGAVDNASGVAGIIEIAKTFQTLNEKPKRSILFIATTAEEMGLLGSVYYNRDPIFPISKTVANLNLDAHHPYGRTSVTVGVVYGRSEMDAYMERAGKLQERTIIPNPHPQTNVFFRSDHYPFVEKGIPATFAVGSGGALDMSDEEWNEKVINYVNNSYHRPSDEFFEGFDCRGIAQDAEFLFLIGYELSNNNDFPQWYRDQPFYRIRSSSIN